MDGLEELLDDLLPPGWSHDADSFGSDFSFYCPHGEEIEQDGSCCYGCVSPLRALGLV